MKKMELACLKRDFTSLGRYDRDVNREAVFGHMKAHMYASKLEKMVVKHHEGREGREPVPEGELGGLREEGRKGGQELLVGRGPHGGRHPSHRGGVSHAEEQAPTEAASVRGTPGGGVVLLVLAAACSLAGAYSPLMPELEPELLDRIAEDVAKIAVAKLGRCTSHARAALTFSLNSCLRSSFLCRAWSFLMEEASFLACRCASRAMRPYSVNKASCWRLSS